MQRSGSLSDSLSDSLPESRVDLQRLGQATGPTPRPTVGTGLLLHTPRRKALGTPKTSCPHKLPGQGPRPPPTYLMDGVVTVLPVDERVENVEIAVRLPLPLRPPPV